MKVTGADEGLAATAVHEAGHLLPHPHYGSGCRTGTIGPLAGHLNPIPQPILSVGGYPQASDRRVRP